MIIVVFFIAGLTVMFLGLALFGLLSMIWPALIPLALVLAYKERNQQRRWEQEHLERQSKVW